MLNSSRKFRTAFSNLESKRKFVSDRSAFSQKRSWCTFSEINQGHWMRQIMSPMRLLLDISCKALPSYITSSFVHRPSIVGRVLFWISATSLGRDAGWFTAKLEFALCVVVSRVLAKMKRLSGRLGRWRGSLKNETKLTVRTTCVCGEITTDPQRRLKRIINNGLVTVQQLNDTIKIPFVVY